MDTPTTFGERLRHVMREKKVGVNELGRRTGKSGSQITRWGNRKTPPGGMYIDLLAENISCSSSYLETGEGEPFPEEPRRKTTTMKNSSTKSGRDTIDLDVKNGEDIKISTTGDTNTESSGEFGSKPLEKKFIELYSGYGYGGLLKKFIERLEKVKDDT